MTRVALLTKRADIVRDTPNFSKKKFLYRLSRTEYEQEWGVDYKKPGPGARIVAFLFRLVPKVGPLKAIDFKVPTTATEALFIKSINSTTDQFQTLVDELRVGPIHLINRDCDTGKATRPGEYKLTDAAYAKLLHRLSLRSFDLLTPELKDNITNYYADLNAPFATRQSKDQWKVTLQELESLKAVSGMRAALPISGK
jgi:hypothetical protein